MHPVKLPQLTSSWRVLFFTVKSVAVLTTAFCSASIGTLLVCHVVELSARALGFGAYQISASDFTSFVIIGGFVAVAAGLSYGFLSDFGND